MDPRQQVDRPLGAVGETKANGVVVKHFNAGDVHGLDPAAVLDATGGVAPWVVPSQHSASLSAPVITALRTGVSLVINLSSLCPRTGQNSVVQEITSRHPGDRERPPDQHTR